MTQAPTASVREEPLRIPTYHIAEDPNPPLFAAWDPWVYPYPRRDEILRPRDEEQTYQAIVLENPYLRATVLPELGGRVYSAYDKAGEREIFYKVPVIKPGLIGLRGAWICGGIEFNFVKGHHVMTTSPVDHLTRAHEDGSVSVTVGHTERRSRARWNVTLTLRPNRAYLQVDLRLYNRNRYRLDFYQWSNSSVVAREDLTFPYPTEYTISSGRRLYRFPIQGGADISRWTTIPIAHDLFSIGSESDFFGVYYEDADVGMVHYADHHQAPGKKLFTWGTDDAGRIWDYLLTDSDVPYIEPQAGCVVDQRTFLFLQPHQTVSWREYWWGIRDMRGFVEVNAEAALNLAPLGEERTLLAVNTTGAHRGARLYFVVNGEQRYETALDVSPEQPWREELELPPAAWRDAEADLILCDAQGNELIRHHRLAPNMFAKVELPRPFSSEVDARSSAEELCIAANEAEKLREYDRAEALYHQALAMDSGYARAQTHLGALLSQQGLYHRALEALTAAVGRDPDNGMAQYHLGIVCRELEDWTAAREHFWAVRLDPGYNSQAFHFLGEMALAEGQLEEAEARFRDSLDLNRLHLKAHGMLAMVLRQRGREAGARSILEAVLEGLDPTDILAQAELWRLEPSEARRARLLERIGGDVQVLLELACDYITVAQYADAVEVLSLWPGVAERESCHPLVYYYLGYCQDKLGRASEARALYELASQMDSAYVFPHRLEELDILTRALAIHPKDAQALAYRSTLLYALRRKEEALADWQASLALQPSAVVHRNVGKTLWKDEGDLTGARAHYERAIRLNPRDHRLYADLNDVLVEVGALPEERALLLESAPPHGRVQARLADALVEAEQWDEAIDVLSEMQFDPYEGERGTRPTYYAAYVGRALERYHAGDLPGALEDLRAALAYPRNIGVGKSYYAQDTKALYWAGVVSEALGDGERARGYWEEGAAIRPHPQDELTSPREGYDAEARTYKSLCLQRLGRGKEAAQLF